MLRYAVRALPWGRIVASALLVLVLMDVVRRWPWQVWPLQGIAVGVVAAGTAWCLDEPAAQVVDAAPRPLWWRTVARTMGVAVLLAAWLVGVGRAGESLLGHPEEVLLQGLAAAAVGAAWATWRRAAGHAVPGHRFAVVVIPVVTMWALVRPLDRRVPVFPYADRGDWAVSTAGWAVLGTVAGALLLLVLADARWWGTGANSPRE